MRFTFSYLCRSVAYVDNRSSNERPTRGTHVDSISYYTYDLADCNKRMYAMQQRKAEIARTGNSSNHVDTWLARLMISANEVADQIMVDSAEDNALRANYTGTSFDGGMGNDPVPQAELMSSHYGSFGHNVAGMSPRTSQCLPYAKRYERNLKRHEPVLSGITSISSGDSDEEVGRLPAQPVHRYGLLKLLFIYRRILKL